MALSDMQVDLFLKTISTVRSQILATNVNLFNQATEGGMLLRAGANSGNYAEQAIWSRISGLLLDRDVNDDSTDVAAVKLAQTLDRSVKVGWATPPVSMTPSWMTWIGKAPEEAGAELGRQIAEEQLAHMVSRAVSSVAGALVNEATNYYDGTGVGAGLATWSALLYGAAKMGDHAEQVRCWAINSKVATDIYAANLANAQNLFSFGTVNVKQDPFGRKIVITDAPALILATNPVTYYTVGLVPGGVVVEENAIDYLQNVNRMNGKVNIQESFQAQGSYNLGLKGFAWDKGNGGASPALAALALGSNWDKYAASAKDLAGVIVKTK